MAIPYEKGWVVICRAVLVDESEVFHWERAGVAYEEGAAGWIEFRFCINGKPFDDYAQMKYLIGGLNPADNYMLRKTIPGKAVVTIEARNMHGITTFQVWGMIDGWMVNKDLQGLME